MAFTHSIRVRYGEVDMQGVVFNAHWLTYFDDAITRYFAHLGYPVEETFAERFDIMLVKAVIEWKGAAGYEDQIAIDVVPVRLGSSSFDIRFSAKADRRLACEATVTYVVIEPGRKASVALPDDLRARLTGEMDQPTAR